MMKTHVALIGAGPIGLEVAVELKRAGVEYVHLDKGPIASTIMRYPPGTTYFSSPERIAIAGIPIQNTGQTKTTKEQYIAYLRSVAIAFQLKINTFEEVHKIERPADGGFLLHSTTSSGAVPHIYRAEKIVLAIGDMETPRRLDIPGEDLPHVSHYMQDPHVYHGRRVLIVGGRNSAAEAALRCHQAGADVSLSYRGGYFDEKTIKYWIMPELRGRIQKGEINAHFSTVPVQFTPTHAVLDSAHDVSGESTEVPADFVLLLTGYRPDWNLYHQLGVELDGPEQMPLLTEKTMETNVPGVYVAGTATAGEQMRFRIFIENCHHHGRRIVNSLLGKPPPDGSAIWALPES